MNWTNEVSDPDGRTPAPTPSAVARLMDIREHQGSLAYELAHNWKGWLGSLFFHGSILLLFAVLTWGVVAPKPPPVEPPIDTRLVTARPLDTERVENLFPDSPVNTPNEGPPDLPAEGKRPNPAMPGPEDIGAIKFIGREGPEFDVDGPGGPPGTGLSGKRIRGILEEKGYGRGLDIVFVFDSTGSMGGIILEVKERIRQFVKGVTFYVPNTRLGLVTYRDKKKYDLDDYQYTVRYLPLTLPKGEGLDKITRFLRETEAYGGGDIPEAVHEGVQAAVDKMEWRPGTKKIIVVFGDAPPRPEDNGLSKLVDMIKVWHDKTGGVLSAIDTTGGSKLMDEFKQMADSGQGRSCFLNDEHAIVRQLMVTVFPEDLTDDVGVVWDRFFGRKDKDVIEQK